MLRLSAWVRRAVSPLQGIDRLAKAGGTGILSETTAYATGEPGSVTVIIPVYNGEPFIRRALDSVLQQTHPAAQIIVVDDGSKDATREIVAREYGDKVTLIAQQNGGPSKARNAGQRVATGEFIGFLDADDQWFPERLERQIAVLRQRPETVGNYTGLRVMDAQNEFLGDLLPKDPDRLWPALRWCNPGVPPSSALLLRSALDKIGGFQEHLWGVEDWDLWIRLSKLGPFCVCLEPLTYYQASSTGVSSDPDRLYNDFLQILDDTLLADLSGVSKRMWRRRIISYQAYKSCLTARAGGDKIKERKYMIKSLLAWPSPFWAPERFRAFAVTMLRS